MDRLIVIVEEGPENAHLHGVFQVPEGGKPEDAVKIWREMGETCTTYYGALKDAGFVPVNYTRIDV